MFCQGEPFTLVRIEPLAARTPRSIPAVVNLVLIEPGSIVKPAGAPPCRSAICLRLGHHVVKFRLLRRNVHQKFMLHEILFGRLNHIRKDKQYRLFAALRRLHTIEQMQCLPRVHPCRHRPERTESGRQSHSRVLMRLEPFSKCGIGRRFPRLSAH